MALGALRASRRSGGTTHDALMLMHRTLREMPGPAVTAMTLAGPAAEADLNEQHHLWPFTESWAAELALTGSGAINRASQPSTPRQQHDRESEPPDLEAGR